jgi:hemin uptake protein HemP
MRIEPNNPRDKLEDSGDERTVRILDHEIDSQELFQTARELKIRHGEDIYRLRRTGLNKLILTK